MRTLSAIKIAIMDRVRQSVRRGITLAGCVGIILVILSPGDALSIFGFSEEEKKHEEATPAIPSEYQGKQMPDGWLTDPKVLAAGKAIYEGTANHEVDCASCHGMDGKPTRKGRGAPDLSDPAEAPDSDARWFWEISEGRRRTKMQGHEKHLSEEERWQVIAYMRTFIQKK